VPPPGNAEPNASAADFQIADQIMQTLFPGGPAFMPAAVLFRLYEEAKAMRAGGLSHLLALLEDPAGKDRLKRCFLFGAHDLFRDPFFYIALRRRILPLYANRPLKVWFPVTGTGCELYSILALLAEERSVTFDSTRIHATDFNDAALRTASSGAVVPDRESMYRGNYKKAEGKTTLDDYIQELPALRFSPALLSRVIFAPMDAANPRTPDEPFDLIVCRDMLQSMTETWRARLADVCMASLKGDGFFCTGYRERLSGIPAFRDLEAFESRSGIYRKKP